MVQVTIVASLLEVGVCRLMVIADLLCAMEMLLVFGGRIVWVEVVGVSLRGGCRAQECTLVHDPPAPWDQVHTPKDVVPAPTTIGQPPRKDPQTGYSKIVPQSGRKYR
ncbi:hypothetical protein Tco_0118032 [Tanacetum coccineum]